MAFLQGFSDADALVQRLATWGERAGLLPAHSCLEELRGLALTCRTLPLGQQAIIRCFVQHVLARLISTLQNPASLLERLCELNAAPWWQDGWLSRVLKLADEVEAALRQQNDVQRGLSTLEVRVAKALRLIDTGYAESTMSLQWVAAQVGLSASYLAHALKTQTGMGFVARVRSRRLAAAKHLLESTVLSIKSVAGKSGYRTLRHLERDFKRTFGVVPTALRRPEADKSDAVDS